MSRDFIINQIASSRQQFKELNSSIEPFQEYTLNSATNGTTSNFTKGTLKSVNYDTTQQYAQDELFYFIIKPKNATTINLNISGLGPSGTNSSFIYLNYTTNINLLNAPIGLNNLTPYRGDILDPEFLWIGSPYVLYNGYPLSATPIISNNHVVISWGADQNYDPLVGSRYWKIEWTSDGQYADYELPILRSTPGPLSIKTETEFYKNYKLTKG